MKVLCSDRVMAVSMGVALFVSAGAPAWGQTTRYVDDDTCPAVGSGTEGDPYCKIQDGINASSDGDTVLVSPGTYDQPIRFYSRQIELRSTDGRECTTIQRSSGVVHVVRIEGEQGNETVLEGFTITGAGTGGSGVKVTDSDPTIRNCIIEYNTIGIKCVRSDPTISNCIIRDNTNTGEGGGIRLESSHPLITDTVISGNKATYGGGIWVEHGRVAGSSVMIVRCVIEDNEATTYHGGGILMKGSTNPAVHIFNSVIRNNTAAKDGGGIGANPPEHRSGDSCETYNKTLTITNTLIACNTAGRDGGGVFNGGRVSGTISNSTFTGNTAGIDGGAIYAFCSPLVIANSILWGDTATGNGDEIAIYDTPPGPVKVRYSDVQGGEGGVSGTVIWEGGNINDDPLFVDPVGPDSTACTADDDYRLRIDTGSPPDPSPCIDTGDNADVVAGYPDLDEGPRIVDGNGSEIVDMGAYEYDDCTVNADCDDADVCNGPEVCGDGNCRPTITDLNGNGILDFCDFNDCGCTGGNQSEDCNDNQIHDGCEGGPFDAKWIFATPAHEESLWRSQKNIVRLTFACDINAPGTGHVKIRQMEDDNAFGDDLSSYFSFTVENDRVLRIYETTSPSVLDHREWYAIGNTDDSWDDVACFEVQYLLQVGDASNNGFVTNGDLGLINDHMGPTGGADDSRYDIDGSMFVNNEDLNIANNHLSGYVPKPTDHDAPCP